MPGMLLGTPGMHTVRGVAKGSRHPRPLHTVSPKSLVNKGITSKGYQRLGPFVKFGPSNRARQITAVPRAPTIPPEYRDYIVHTAAARASPAARAAIKSPRARTRLMADAFHASQSRSAALASRPDIGLSPRQRATRARARPCLCGTARPRILYPRREVCARATESKRCVAHPHTRLSRGAVWPQRSLARSSANHL